jgi:hypothetical protein
MTVEQAIQKLAQGKSLLQDNLTPEQIVELKGRIQFEPLVSNIGLEFEMYTPGPYDEDADERILNHFQSYGLHFHYHEDSRSYDDDDFYDEERDDSDTVTFGKYTFYGDKGSPRRDWALMGDGSIQPEAAHIGFELVSPVLTPRNYIDELTRFVKAMNHRTVLDTYLMKFNNSCGLHIHFDHPSQDLDQKKKNAARIYHLWTNIQQEIAYYLLPNHREGAYYAKFNPPIDFDVTLPLSTYIGGSRYKMLAIRSNTIEVRLFPMSRNLHTIQRRILLIDRIIQYAIDERNDIVNVSLFKDVLNGHVWLQNYLLATRKKLISNPKSENYIRTDETVIPIY